MKNTDAFDKFEQLLKSKSYNDLSAEERLLVSEFVTETEYLQMAALLDDVSQPEIADVTVPEGGADEIWSRFEANIPQKKRALSFVKRRVSIMWPMTMAASILLLLFIRFPHGRSVFYTAMDRNTSVYTVILPVQNEVIREIPVYINQSNSLDIAYTEAEPMASDGSMFVPEPETIATDKSQRQGVNTSEMGNLTNLFVSVN